MRLFGKYLWQYRLVFLLLLLFVGIFTGIFALYDLEAEAVLYAAGWCLFCAVLLLGGRFLRFRKRHMELIRIRGNIALLADELPEPKSLLEEDYQGMIGELQRIGRASPPRHRLLGTRASITTPPGCIRSKRPSPPCVCFSRGKTPGRTRALLAELFRIEQYVEMVLCYFRLDSDSSDFLFRQYDLDGIIKQAVRKYASQFVHKRIRLVYQPVAVTVLTDEKWLLFILEQLLSNAIKYTDRGEIRISVSDDKVLHIADTGIGIAPEDLPRVFDKGFTGYNGRADKKSTGLGLYLCRQAAAKLSHTLRIVSEPGKGDHRFHWTSIRRR